MSDYKFIDRRYNPKPKPVCRVCGSLHIHSEEYNKPTIDCIEYLRSIISSYKTTLEILEKK